MKNKNKEFDGITTELFRLIANTVCNIDIFYKKSVYIFFFL